MIPKIESFFNIFIVQELLRKSGKEVSIIYCNLLRGFIAILVSLSFMPLTSSSHYRCDLIPGEELFKYAINSVVNVI